MTLCVIDGGHCDCQPGIGSFCARVTRLRTKLADMTRERDDLVYWRDVGARAQTDRERHLSSLIPGYDYAFSFEDNLRRHGLEVEQLQRDAALPSLWRNCPKHVAIPPQTAFVAPVRYRTVCPHCAAEAEALSGRPATPGTDLQ